MRRALTILVLAGTYTLSVCGFHYWDSWSWARGMVHAAIPLAVVIAVLVRLEYKAGRQPRATDDQPR